MKKRTVSRKPVVLSESTQRRLGMYALTASAAGVAVLALSQPAEGKIVYHKAHIEIGIPGYYFLDLVGSHRSEFIFANIRNSGNSYMFVLGGQRYGLRRSNAVWCTSTFDALASALGPGVTISNNPKHFVGGRADFMAEQFEGAYYGQWRNVTNRFLGLKFLVRGKFHFGWARLSTQGMTDTLTGYAYESIPNMPIITGKTKDSGVIAVPAAATLGHLALGRK